MSKVSVILEQTGAVFVQNNEHYNICNGRFDLWVTDIIMFKIYSGQQMTAVDIILRDLGIVAKYRDGFGTLELSDVNLVSLIKVATDLVVKSGYELQDILSL